MDGDLFITVFIAPDPSILELTLSYTLIPWVSEMRVKVMGRLCRRCIDL